MGGGSKKMAGFDLPKKLPAYRLRLHVQYSHSGERQLRDVIGRSYADIIEEAVYDQWNGGTYGHDVNLYLPIKELGKVHIDEIDDVERRICDDLNKVSDGDKNEFFSAVYLKLFEETNEKCRRAKPLGSRPELDADTMRMWKRGMVRLFISHRDEHKVKANELAQALEAYGISSFVAHDSIKPMTVWQAEIVKGLDTMEIMLAFVTDDFHDSVWANQEIGFALGRNIPIVSLKLQKRDPQGFVAGQQALKCSFKDVDAAAPRLYRLLVDRLDNGDRLQQSVIRAFLESPNFDEARLRFDRMEAVVSELSDSEVEEIQNGFRENDQLHKAYYLGGKHERLARFLARATGKSFVIEGKNISGESDQGDD